MSEKSICKYCAKKRECDLQDIERTDSTITVCAAYLGKGQVNLQEPDAVSHPAHYTAGGIECIDAIRASLGKKEFADYCKGNIIKYLWRYRLKNGVEDLKKAKVYLDWMIEAEGGT